MLNPIELSATAPGRSDRGTISPTDACQAGPLNAVPTPIRKVNTSSRPGVIHPAQVKTESSAETMSMKLCAASITYRRSRLSAMAPAASASSMIGSVVDACTSATIVADVVIDVIIHDAPTDWISPPKFDARLAIHMSRKTRWRSGASAGARAGDGTSGE